jgi:hypothetical protein
MVLSSMACLVDTSDEGDQIVYTRSNSFVDLLDQTYFGMMQLSSASSLTPLVRDLQARAVKKSTSFCDDVVS